MKVVVLAACLLCYSVSVQAGTVTASSTPSLWDMWNEEMEHVPSMHNLFPKATVVVWRDLLSGLVPPRPRDQFRWEWWQTRPYHLSGFDWHHRHISAHSPGVPGLRPSATPAAVVGLPPSVVLFGSALIAALLVGALRSFHLRA